MKIKKFIEFFEHAGVKIDTDVKIEGDWKKDEELLSLAWNFILDPEADSLMFQDEACKKIIELSKKYPKLREESIEYIRKRGGILYRGVKITEDEEDLFDKDGNYRVGQHKSIDSFTVDKKIAEDFSHDQYIIAVPLSQIEQNVVFSIDVLLNGVYVPDEHSFYLEDDNGISRKSLPSQREIFVRGPLTIEKKFIKETNPDHNFVVSEIKKFIKKTYKEAVVSNQGPGDLIAFIGKVFVRIMSYDPNVLDIVKGEDVNREKANSKRWPNKFVEKEVTVERKGESTEKWIQKIKDAIAQF